jgi:hypothetical protein
MSEPLNGTIQDPPSRFGEYACITFIIKIVYQLIYTDSTYLFCNGASTDWSGSADAGAGSLSQSPIFFACFEKEFDQDGLWEQTRAA